MSAVSENHAGEGRSMVARLAKDHPDWSVVLYDMGLKNDTRAWFEVRFASILSIIPSGRL